MYSKRAFTLVELLVVLSIIILVASATLAYLVDARLNARDKTRMDQLNQIRTALQLYETDHGYFPKEADGANGNASTNSMFLNMLRPYIKGTTTDPAAAGDPIFYYYYDGSAECGGEKDAIIFARQMDKAGNSNYTEFLNTTCRGTLDGEGRGGGAQSYNLRLGKSGG